MSSSYFYQTPHQPNVASFKKSKRTKEMGPTQPVSEWIHSTKYRAKGESFREAMGRVAQALKDNDDHFHTTREILLDMRFMPAGRIQAAVGQPKAVTPYNCYVSGTIEDSFIDGSGSIMERAKQAAATMRMGGGIGYDFSTLRPRGARIKKLDSQSSGPISFMKIYDAICKCVASSGHRRGAQMGVLRVDHPDIEEFIHAKQNHTELTGFNLSVAITDEFMNAVLMDESFDLRFGGQVYDTISARALWEKIMRSTWDWAEPGVLFIDRINEDNNLHYCETIAATNPCGEQPLPPFGACLLGSFNLVKYVVESPVGFVFDWDQFKKDIPPIVRMMDNVVDRAIYPLYEQEKEAKSKRRMGLGITGLANAIEVCGHPYGSDGFIRMTKDIMRTLANEAYQASALLAAEKGAFPLYDQRVLESGYSRRALDPTTQALIKKHGLRNSHLISVAPTGTISLSADNVSSGCEPVFAVEYERTIQTFDGPETHTVRDYALDNWGFECRSAGSVTAQEHVDVLCAVQEFTDSAVSKTCNVPPDMAWEDFKEIYLSAWRGGAKGCTTFNAGGKRFGILRELPKVEDGAQCAINLNTCERECG